jgi:hypothetical protein
MQIAPLSTLCYAESIVISQETHYCYLQIIIMEVLKYADLETICNTMQTSKVIKSYLISRDIGKELFVIKINNVIKNLSFRHTGYFAENAVQYAKQDAYFNQLIQAYDFDYKDILSPSSKEKALLRSEIIRHIHPNLIEPSGIFESILSIIQLTKTYFVIFAKFIFTSITEPLVLTLDEAVEDMGLEIEDDD